MMVMDRQDHVNKAKELLGNQDAYRPISKDPTPKLKNQLNKFSRTVNHKDRLTKLLTKDCILLVPSQQKFYGLSKIHKLGTPGQF